MLSWTVRFLRQQPCRAASPVQSQAEPCPTAVAKRHHPLHQPTLKPRGQKALAESYEHLPSPAARTLLRYPPPQGPHTAARAGARRRRPAPPAVHTGRRGGSSRPTDTRSARTRPAPPAHVREGRARRTGRLRDHAQAHLPGARRRGRRGDALTQRDYAETVGARRIPGRYLRRAIPAQHRSRARRALSIAV